MIKAKTGVLLLLLCVVRGLRPGMKSEIKVDPAYRGKVYHSFMVLGFSDEYKQRKAFEYDMAEIMRKWGLKAIPSLSVVGDEHSINSSIIKAAAQKAKVQAVLMGLLRRHHGGRAPQGPGRRTGL